MIHEAKKRGLAHDIQVPGTDAEWPRDGERGHRCVTLGLAGWLADDVTASLLSPPLVA